MIDHPIMWIPSPHPMGCWAASASMMLGRSPSVRSVRIAANGGLPVGLANLRSFANELGLKLIPGITLSPSGLENLLANGPVMFCGTMTGGLSHAIVIGGINGDMVRVYDPAPSAGGGKWVSYVKLVNIFPAASRFVLHK